MKTDRERRICIVTRKGSGLWPVSAADEEIICGLSQMKEIEISFKYRRVPEQLRAYWWFLSYVVEATEAYESAEHLHNAIKFELGYVKKMARLSGEIVIVPDSVALSAMDGMEFTEYFKKAEKLIAERFGIVMPEKPADVRRAA
ncbi:MAG: hypothetical protein Q8L53_16905 [Aestuariivirga sp.]|nr:hypothetical protein [Aestuariivirga sp.]